MTITAQAPTYALMPTPVRDPRDLALIAALRDGLPLTLRPYAALGKAIGLSEGEVLARLRTLRDDGALRRFGAIVRHHEAGYAANAMVVLAPPAGRVRTLGQRLAAEPSVTLCYQRAPAPGWPYTLYCMVHGHDRATVLAGIAAMLERHRLDAMAHKILFSRRRFKQTAGHYGHTPDNHGPRQAAGGAP